MKTSITTAILSFVISFGFFCFGQCAQAAPGDNTGENVQEENYLRETQLLRKEQEMQDLTEGDEEVTDLRFGLTARNKSETIPDKIMRPRNTNKSAKAETQAGASQLGNSAGDLARDMALTAIDYSSRFMKNFTTADGNRWNRYRNELFIPIALLLILPGAVLTQLRAIIAQGNPVVGQASPLEGIQRAIIAVFLVPATCLVTNYAIDLGNSLHYSVCSEYSRIVGGDMYRDAMCAEIRAFGVRYLSENEGSMNVPAADLSPRGSEPFAKIEGRLWGKLQDPCVGLLLVPANRDEASMPQSSIAVRMAMYTANAGICAGWSMLTAFQMAFFYYLYFVGPIMAALWAWPMHTFKNALPTWVEGCVTLAFWSFIWQICIAILAMTKSPASTGLYMVTACNVLATTAVKHAFDFSALLRSAVQQAEMIGSEAAANAGGGGGGGGKGGSKSGSKGGAKTASKPGAAPDKAPTAPPAERPDAAPAAARTPLRVTHDDEGFPLPTPSRVPAVLKPSKEVIAPAGVIVQTSLPPAAGLGDSITPAAFRGTVFDDPVLGAFAASSMANLSFNAVTGTWNNPLMLASLSTPGTGSDAFPAAAAAATPVPPSAGPGRTPLPRNTIASVVGNAIETVMHYPANVPIQDPDLSIREEEIKELEIAHETEQEKVSFEGFEQQISQEIPPPLLESEEQEMNSNDDPRFAEQRDQRFVFTPPPMVSTQTAGARFQFDPSATPQELLAKLQLVSDETSFAPPPPPPAPPATEPVLQVSSSAQQIQECAFRRLENSFQFDTDTLDEGTIVTVADFTIGITQQVQPLAKPVGLNAALGQVLRQRGTRVQVQAQAKEPAGQSVSTSWWS